MELEVAVDDPLSSLAQAVTGDQPSAFALPPSTVLPMSDCERHGWERYPDIGMGGTEGREWRRLPSSVGRPGNLVNCWRAAGAG